MQAPMSMAERLINAIGNGRIRHVKLKRSGVSIEESFETWADINKVLGARYEKLDRVAEAARDFLTGADYLKLEEALAALDSENE